MDKEQVESIRKWLEDTIRSIIDLPEDIDIHVSQPLMEIGLTSEDLVALQNQLNREYKQQLNPSFFFEYNTIEQISNFLNANDGLDRHPRALPSTRKEWEPNYASNPIDEIAVIGMAGKFPGATNIEEYWENLSEGVNSVTEIPRDRWDWKQYYGDPLKNNKTNSKWGGFIEGVDQFDSLFFRVSPKETSYTDPQHRLFLETVWQTIEHAGYSPSDLAGRKIGVYAGVSKNDYAELLGDDISAFVSTGTVHSILANRVSYFFDFRGPSEAIDTACSSSLVALHNAVRSIRDGECEAAIVGGVNALLSPKMYISHAKSGMLSPEGKCKTFDASADGYVRGEGVGAIFLKPLNQALEDRDNILGIIKSTAVNHGGRSNFLTAPSVTAQAEVVYTAMKKADVDPRSIGYIEAHGTGTPLGDPVEISALRRAYDQSFKDIGVSSPTAYCGLGSVKTNIGHLESAAGMASIMKVLLAMKHRTIPSISHFHKLNPYIELDDSPFYIVEESKEWKRPRINRKTLRRRAGVSGFGMGGVNVHVILEEAPELKRGSAIKGNRGKLLFLFSARKGRLRTAAEQWVKFLAQDATQALPMEDIAFTLMFGREAFEERLAIVGESADELKLQLELFLQDEPSDDYKYGLKSDAEGEAALEASYTGDLLKLSEQWVKGSPLNWLEESFPGRRTPIPGYPFERRSYWFKKKVEQENGELQNTGDIHANQTWEKSTLIPSHLPLISEHRVQAVKVLPGMGYLELVSSALSDHMGYTDGDEDEWHFENVYWLKPLKVMEEDIEAELAFRQSQATLRFEVRTFDGLHCQGEVTCQSRCAENSSIDVQAIANRCSSTLEGSGIYRLFEENGLSYGPAFQQIDRLHWNDNEALAEISNAKDQAFFSSLLDGALQTAVGLSVLNGSTGNAQFVPYSAENVRCVKNMTSAAYYYVRQADTKLPSVLTFDLFICDAAGYVIADLRNFTKLEYNGPTESMETLYYSTKWDRLPARSLHSEVNSLLIVHQDPDVPLWLPSMEDVECRVAYIRASNRFMKIDDSRFTVNSDHTADYESVLDILLKEGWSFSHIVVLGKTPGMPDMNVLLRTIQSVMTAKIRKKIRLLYVYQAAAMSEMPEFYAAGGLSRTLTYEYPAIEFSVVGLGPDASGLKEAVLKELDAPCDSLREVRYEGNTRFVRVPVPLATPSEALNINKTSTGMIRRGGVYLLAGGSGGIGRLLAEYLVRNYDAQLILWGRQPMGAELREFMETLANQNGTIDYVTMDYNNEHQVFSEMQRIRERCGSLNGVIQMAGTIEDSFIFRKEPASFERVLQPKLAVTKLLDKATIEDRLDFFVMFSSVASLMPNQGQADYATGNSYLDAFSVYRNEQVRQGIRYGMTLSINWPLWAEGGMSVLEEEKEHLWDVFGMQPLKTREGMEIFEKALIIGKEMYLDHLLAIVGDRHKIEASLGIVREAEGLVGGVDVRETCTSLIDLNQSQPSKGLFRKTYFNNEFYMLDHVVDGKYNMPGACYVEMARQAGILAEPGKRLTKLVNAYWAKQLSSRGEAFTVHIQLMKKENLTDYEIYSLQQDTIKTVHAVGSIMYAEEEDGFQTVRETLDVSAIRQRCVRLWNRNEVYRQIHAEGLHVGPTFMPMDELVCNELEALGTLELPDEVKHTNGEYGLHPTMLTGVFQTALINNRYDGDDAREFIPIGIGSLEISGTLPERCLVYSKVKEKTRHLADIQKFDIWVCDKNGYVFWKLTDFAIRAVQAPSVEGAVHSFGGQRVKDEGIADSRNGQELTVQAEQYLRELISPIIGIDSSDIHPEEDFESYGINSVLILELNKELADIFGSRLSKTLFFEYRNLRELSAYFVEEFSDVLISRVSPTVMGHMEDASAQLEKPKNAEERPNSSGSDDIGDREGDISLRDQTENSIAIIGLAGRYPDSKNMREFWNNLVNGKDSIEEIPNDRFDYTAYYEKEHSTGKINSKWGSFLDDIDKFDPMFFNISAREAERMDPQERIFLQTVWHALEDAGYTRQALADKTVGVFAGALWQTYLELGVQGIIHNQASESPSTLLYNIANRVSYFCDFNGPSLTVDTACSSSLTALHLACQSILTGESELAIAGGVNLSIGVSKYLFLSQYNFLSSEGKCRSFGAGGDGYVPGEGCGAVILKPLKLAVEDGDHIYGVIRSTVVNHGGKTNGYTVPNPNAQADMLLKALQRSKIHPRTISYIEAHGTGTLLGDPIEINSLNKAYSFYTDDKQFCAIGSVKSNIGHLEASAGIAGLTKVLLQLKNQKIAPSLHAEELNPNIDFQQSAFKVAAQVTDWARPVLDLEGTSKEYPRVAGISSFGAGGSNAHAIIEEYSPFEEMKDCKESGQDTRTSPFIFVLSAKDKERLNEYVDNWLETISLCELKDSDLSNLTYTLQIGREAMEERMGTAVRSLKELERNLLAYRTGDTGTGEIQNWFAGRVSRNANVARSTADNTRFDARGDGLHSVDSVSLIKDWIEGKAINWMHLYSGRRPRRMSLPAYPFAKERYWITDAWDQDRSFQSPHSVLESMSEISRSKRTFTCVSKHWEAAPMEANGASARDGEMVAIHAARGSMELARVLQRLLPGAGLFTTEALEASLNQPADAWQAYTTFIDLAGDDEAAGQEHEAAVAWLQRFVAQDTSAGRVAILVTRGLERIDGGRTLSLSGAARAGLYRTLPCEYSRLNAAHLDVDPEAEIAVQAEQVLVELAVGAPDGETGWRQGIRYRARLGEAPPAAAVRGERPEWDPARVLLVTGGTRGLGYACARHLVEHAGVKRVVLTGRELLPARPHWEAELAGEKAGSPRALKLRALLELEALGAEVEVLSTDLADREALFRTLERVRLTRGAIGGVLHCAGLADGETPAFIRKSREGMRQVLEPKVAGLNHLLAGVEQDPLQFLVLFSSVSAAVPRLGAGQSDYAMANGYMDYVAGSWSGACPAVSVQWPSWRDTGMGEATSAVYRESGLHSLSTAEGLEILEHVLREYRGPVVLPAVVDPQTWRPEQLLQRPSRRVASREEVQARKTASHTEGGPTSASVEQWLRSLIAQELKYDPSRLERDVPFPDYGVDSILLTQLLRRIREEIGQELEPTLLYEYPTLAELSARLAPVYGRRDVDHGQPKNEGEADRSPFRADRPIEDVTAAEGATAGNGDIAVVGMSCRFPGAPTLDAYWELLSNGRRAIGPVPASRFGAGSGYQAGLLDDVGWFDPSYFLIPPSDAQAMDPQALVLLEESLSVIHHAGYRQEDLKGRAVGVYVGGRSMHQPDKARAEAARNVIVAVGQNYLAANVSQYFDLRGPSIVVDTACSSALVGMNMAIQALRNGEIEAAIVGGVSVLPDERVHQMFDQRGLLSRDSAFHIFDRRSKGIVPGEGAGVVLLKTVEEAKRSGDRIYAVIKGMAINNDGRTAGPATPNLEAQKSVMRKALKASGKRAGEVGYVEANGSGTEVTDLLELKGLEEVYRQEGEGALEVGSMKPNIGHPLCAEGIAGFIKAALMVEKGKIVPFLSGEAGMEHYRIEESPLRLSRELKAWEGKKRTAGVSCFADGGTNAHVIIEQWDDPEQRGTTSRSPLSVPQLNRYEVGNLDVEPKIKVLTKASPSLLNTSEVLGAFWMS